MAAFGRSVRLFRIRPGVVLLANLAPRKIRGLMSNGMVLTAEKDGKLSVLTPAAPVPNGSQIA